MTVAEDHLDRLSDLWQREFRATQAKLVEERTQRSLADRVEAGIALRDLTTEDSDVASGDRTLLWVVPKNLDTLDTVRLRVGNPVRLWWTDPDGPDAVRATLARRRAAKLGIMVDGEVPDRIWDGTFHLDRDDPQQTYKRGRSALRRFREATASPEARPTRHFRDVLLGDLAPELGRAAPPSDWFDEALNDAQREAVALAMRARDVALVHGPPGTGKTRTLVEVIRQAVALDQKVLATAASNTAVDNLAERLVETGLDVVRLGHPARVSQAITARTLDAILEGTAEYKLARKWLDEARQIRRRTEVRSDRGSMRRNERRDAYRQARSLSADARRQIRGAQDRILARAQVVCCTAAGADTRAMGSLDFDLVVLDEATQATTPVALVALGRANRAVLAGDHHQLPPTVIDDGAARDGLAESLFEQLVVRAPDVVQMLEIQHRMHEVLMAFPSVSKYEGRLVAAPEVANRVPPVVDEARPAPLVFIDTAGAGWDEERTEDDPSTCNPGQAERTEKEVRRLVAQGFVPADLAVITPYAAQARRLRRQMTDLRDQGLEVVSIDGFQGREREVIVLDLVRSNPDGDLGFLRDTRRMNVALTRARSLLLVVADSATLGGNRYFAGFLDHVERCGAWLTSWDPV